MILYLVTFLRQQWPARDVYIDVLQVFVIPQQGLGVLPAIQASDITERALNYCLEGVGLTVAPDASLDMSWLDLAAMMNNITVLIDERLESVQSVSLRGKKTRKWFLVPVRYTGNLDIFRCSLAHKIGRHL